ncbi:P-loop containing nucleoside triphosphate hydrolase protein [Dendrothele bispora CBS 962.96]|uniref:DNA 3'-5' helicase n=1 Tax=Dendrothele bispora (strain CBS 962.96) TaxID=1314807 RepID=A0A4S8MMM3_DENBC|nr:P-loop containing nucleoside triphosphate hydrolase protein [Dendrothele bispora CBS 962.96]
MPVVTSVPSSKEYEDFAAKAELILGYKPCTAQLLSAWHQYDQKTVFTIARTGFGKTLTFWLPLLMKEDGVLLIVTPLNILGDKNAREVMEKLGVAGVNVTGQTATEKVFKHIADLKYRVVVTSPELLVSHTSFKKLFENQKFTSKLINITFDEAHCIVAWGSKDFRPEYKETHKLRWYIPENVPYHFTSATLPENIYKEIKDLFNLKNDTIREIRVSNDRPNIHLQSLVDGTERPPKFMVFCNSRKKTEQMAKEMWKGLPAELRERIPWFHSAMTDSFRESTMEKMTKGEIWGLVCTDAAGMGLDVSDVELVVQWGHVDSLETLVQRLGRAGRMLKVEARGVYFVEDKHFDAVRAAAAERKRKRDNAKTKKQDESRQVGSKRKRSAIGPQEKESERLKVRVIGETSAMDLKMVVEDDGNDENGEVQDDGISGNEPIESVDTVQSLMAAVPAGRVLPSRTGISALQGYSVGKFEPTRTRTREKPYPCGGYG